MKIVKLSAREVLDSRGYPTVMCSIFLSDGSVHSAVAPSGKSRGALEAVELRDLDNDRFLGRGVLGAVECITEDIAPLLVGREPDFVVMDSLLLEGDGTHNKSHYGANATIAVSCAVVRAQAHLCGLGLYKFIAQALNVIPRVPRCLFNLINGGAHAGFASLIQEVLCVGERGEALADVLSDIVTFSHYIAEFLVKKQGVVGLGDEGGFVRRLVEPSLKRELEILEDLSCLQEQVFGERDRFCYALDVAASQFYDSAQLGYVAGEDLMPSKKLAQLYCAAIKKWPIVAIEDPFDEKDKLAWSSFVGATNERVVVVGDDLFVTNEHLIREGAREGLAGAVVIKPNQAGTVTEALAAVRAAREVGYAVVVSHRSGETCDHFIADFAVGVRADFAKFGACARSERVSKYNRLLCIEEEILNKKQG